LQLVLLSFAYRSCYNIDYLNHAHFLGNRLYYGIGKVTVSVRNFNFTFGVGTSSPLYFNLTILHVHLFGATEAAKSKEDDSRYLFGGDVGVKSQQGHFLRSVIS
jgi:hypothetical protein